MKVLSYFAILLVLCAGVVSAQNQKKSPDDFEPARPSKSTAMTDSRAGKSLGLESNSTVEAALSGTIDAKNAKIGDEVVLKTTKSIKQNGEVIVPKGSKLIGRITGVTRKGKNSGGSKLGMVFDRLEGKDLSTPITASIISITNARVMSSVNDTAGADIMGSSTTSSRASSRGSGGGLLGGVGGTVSGVVNTTTQVAGSAVGNVGQTVRNTTSVVGQSVNGLQISPSASGSVSGSTVLSSQDKNVRLEKGVTFSLVVRKSAQN